MTVIEPITNNLRKFVVGLALHTDRNITCSRGCLNPDKTTTAL